MFPMRRWRRSWRRWCAQLKEYGRTLNSLRQSAHTPPIALASPAMGRAISRSGQIAPLLASLVNLRVAAIVGCPQ